MKRRYIVKLNKLLVISLFVFLIQTFSFSAKAQQQTGQVAPSTNNPQNGSAELFRQGQNLQTANPQMLPSSVVGIQIPRAKPLPAPAKQKETHYWQIFIAAGCLIIAAGIAVRYLIKEPFLETTIVEKNSNVSIGQDLPTVSKQPEITKKTRHKKRKLSKKRKKRR